MARGEFLVFLDADDALEPDYVERCLARLRAASSDVGFVFTQVRFFGGSAGVSRWPPYDLERIKRSNTINAPVRRRAGCGAPPADASTRSIPPPAARPASTPTS